MAGATKKKATAKASGPGTGSVEEMEVHYDKSNENADYFSKKDLQRLKKMLLDERAAVIGRLDNHVSQATEDRDNLADEMDMATRHSDQAYLLRLADKEHKLLAEIDRALAKFPEGTYGICEGTHEPIDLKRLEIRPWTRYSLEHKEQLEREKGNRAGR